jgi:hypothetical protein
VRIATNQLQPAGCILLPSPAAAQSQRGSPARSRSRHLLGGRIVRGPAPASGQGHAALRRPSQKRGRGRQGEYRFMTLLSGPGCTEVPRGSKASVVAAPGADTGVSGPAWPLSSDRSVRSSRSSVASRDVRSPGTFPLLVSLQPQSRLGPEGRTRTLSGPSPDVSPARAPAPPVRRGDFQAGGCRVDARAGTAAPGPVLGSHTEMWPGWNASWTTPTRSPRTVSRSTVWRSRAVNAATTASAL